VHILIGYGPRSFHVDYLLSCPSVPFVVSSFFSVFRCFTRNSSKMPGKHNADQKSNESHTAYGYKIEVRVQSKFVTTDANSVTPVVVETMVRGGCTDSAAQMFAGYPLELGIVTAGVKPCEALRDKVNKIVQRECNVAFQASGPGVFEKLMKKQAAAKDDKREEVKDKASGVGTNEDEATQNPQAMAKTRSQKKAAEDKGEEERDVESVVELDVADADDSKEEPITFGSFGENSDEEGEVTNLTSTFLQLAAQPTTVIKTSKKEKNFAARVCVHVNEVLRILLEVCANSGNVNLKKAAKSYHNTSTTEIMRCSTDYEAALGVSPGPRVLWQRMKQCLNGNKSAAELSNRERTKLDSLGIVHTGSPNDDLALFSMKFNEQLKVVAATGSALSGEDQVSKFSIALQKGAAASSAYMEAYRFTLEAMRDGDDVDGDDDKVKKQPPTLEYLQVKAREKVEINVDTKAASGGTKGSGSGGGDNQARHKGKGRGGQARGEIDEVSFFNSSSSSSSNGQHFSAQGSFKGKGGKGGKGNGNGSGKGNGNGKDKGFNGSFGNGYGKGKGKGHDGGGYGGHSYGSRNYGDYGGGGGGGGGGYNGYNGSYSGGGGGNHWQYSGKGGYHQSGEAATANKPTFKEIMPQKVMFTEEDVAMDNKIRAVCEAAKEEIAVAVSKHLEKLVFDADEIAAYVSNKKRRQRQDPRRAEESEDESDSSPFGWGS